MDYYVEVRQRGAIGIFQLVRYEAASNDEAFAKAQADGWETRAVGTREDYRRNVPRRIEGFGLCACVGCSNGRECLLPNASAPAPLTSRS